MCLFFLSSLPLLCFDFTSTDFVIELLLCAPSFLIIVKASFFFARCVCVWLSVSVFCVFFARISLINVWVWGIEFGWSEHPKIMLLLPIFRFVFFFLLTSNSDALSLFCVLFSSLLVRHFCLQRVYMCVCVFFSCARSSFGKRKSHIYYFDTSNLRYIIPYYRNYINILHPRLDTFHESKAAPAPAKHFPPSLQFRSDKIYNKQQINRIDCNRSVNGETEDGKKSPLFVSTRLRHPNHCIFHRLPSSKLSELHTFVNQMTMFKITNQ